MSNFANVGVGDAFGRYLRTKAGHAHDTQTACSCDDLRMARDEYTIKDGMEAPIMHAVALVYQATRGNELESASSHRSCDFWFAACRRLSTSCTTAPLPAAAAAAARASSKRNSLPARFLLACAAASRSAVLLPPSQRAPLANCGFRSARASVDACLLASVHRTRAGPPFRCHPIRRPSSCSLLSGGCCPACAAYYLPTGPRPLPPTWMRAAFLYVGLFVQYTTKAGHVAGSCMHAVGGC